MCNNNNWCALHAAISGRDLLTAAFERIDYILLAFVRIHTFRSQFCCALPEQRGSNAADCRCH